MYRLTQFVVLLSLINYSWCNCMEKLKLCDKIFVDEMKSIKYNNADREFIVIFYDICSSDGIYNRFVKCVQDLDGKCDHLGQFRQQICHTRSLKMNSWRYTWKYNLIHDVCYRTLPSLDAEFFKHEKCISKVLNTPQWKCDVTHYNKVKQTNGLQSCPHWEQFRKCNYREVQQACGDTAANVSDYLFHVHGSYFTKYTLCNATGQPYTKCWYDWILERTTPQRSSSSNTVSTIITTISAPATAQTVANSMSQENIAVSESRPHRVEESYEKDSSSHFETVESNQHSTVKSTEWNKVITPSKQQHKDDDVDSSLEHDDDDDSDGGDSGGNEKKQRNYFEMEKHTNEHGSVEEAEHEHETFKEKETNDIEDTPEMVTVVRKQTPVQQKSTTPYYGGGGGGGGHSTVWHQHTYLASSDHHDGDSDGNGDHKKTNSVDGDGNGITEKTSLLLASDSNGKTLNNNDQNDHPVVEQQQQRQKSSSKQAHDVVPMNTQQSKQSVNSNEGKSEEQKANHASSLWSLSSSSTITILCTFLSWKLLFG